MVRIAFCEDEKPQSEYITGLIKTYAQRRHKTIVVDTYTSAEQFLISQEDEQPYHLFILDIQLGKMNGMDLAKKIREKEKEAYIVFLTGLKDYAIEGYEVGAVRYLLKPVREEVLFELLEKICDEIESGETKYFLYQASGCTKRIPFSDIYYIESEGHYVNIHTAHEANRWKSSLSSIAKQFERQGFVVVRRGLYANISHIERIGRLECFLDNGETLPVSKSCYKAINQAFIEYYQERERGDSL